MGSLFRSREMTLCQLFLQSDSAYACVRELGELGMVHFRDLNPDVSAFQRKFVNEVRRCDEMERKLRFLSNELERVGLQPTPVGFVDAPDPQDMIDLESQFEELENEVKEINTNTETLKRNMLDLVELRHIIDKAQGFFAAAEAFTYQDTGATTEEAKGPGLLDDEAPAVAASDQTRLTFVAGVIRRERLQRFEQVLWRACRGNVFVQQAEIEEALEDPATGDPVYKNVFVLFFQGDQLRLRVKKICEGFRATLYECPPTSVKRREMSMAVSGRINDLTTVLQQTKDHSVTQLEGIAGKIETWKQKVVKIKSIFHTMNKFNLDVTARCLIAECWCPVEDLEAIQQALMRGTERSGSSVPSILHRVTTNESPPTYNKTNKFTKGFQAIVDAYGVANYQEVNPAPYAIITFPFLFAVMFGDAGHGFLMALFAFFMILREKQLSTSKAGGDMFQIIFKGRYIVFLMGLFSIYTGLIYNDIFSKSIKIFDSSWNVSFTGTDGHGTVQTFIEEVESGGKTATLLPTRAFESTNPYPFGLDPIWQVSTNKLRFINSYKMKLALILGISQMTFGVILSLFNHIHFKRYIDIVSNFLPQLIFLLSLFGYLVVLILTKWIRPWPEPAGAPSILITMINMFLNFGSSPSDFSVSNPETNPLFGNYAEPQVAIQSFLVVLAVLCVPWMLILKPVYVYMRKRRGKRRGYTITPSRDNKGDGSDDEAALVPGGEEVKAKTGDSGGGGHGDHDSDSMGEVIVLQSIHTIEFCLGCLSHTASYLRLWALSLAHAELSEVLWQQLLHLGYTLSLDVNPQFQWLNPIVQVVVVFGTFAGWAVGTIGVLLVMEGLSAFLHTLRLHWIEFQTKFYVGEGYKFRPFCFADILAGEGDD